MSLWLLWRGGLEDLEAAPTACWEQELLGNNTCCHVSLKNAEKKSLDLSLAAFDQRKSHPGQLESCQIGNTTSRGWCLLVGATWPAPPSPSSSMYLYSANSLLMKNNKERLNGTSLLESKKSKKTEKDWQIQNDTLFFWSMFLAVESSRFGCSWLCVYYNESQSVCFHIILF